MLASTMTKHNSKIDYLRQMLLSREGDKREGILLRQSKGWFHVGSIGHEALSGFGAIMKEGDWIFPHYRDRAMMLSKGITNYELALAYYAKKDSSSGGRQMPGHYSSKKLGIFSVPTPVGSNLLPACGTAWAMKMNGKDSLCIASIGDASCRQGEFYEAIAFAIQEKLPVLFLVQDNKYGISTPTAHLNPYALGGILSKEHVIKVNGRKLDDVIQAAKEAETKARSGNGPTILWLDLDRLSSHTSSDDHRVYRSNHEIAEMEQRDPIQLLAHELIELGELTQDIFEALQKEIAEQVDEDYQRAEKAENPNPREYLNHLWGETVSATPPPVESKEDTTMVEVISKTLYKALEKEETILLFGEDIEDPKGGVFGLTKGLSTAFSDRVINSPLAEATIFGVAVGMALYGMKPVFELQFIDFITPALNQLFTNISTLRWRTCGDLKCPMVIYAPYGAYLPGGSLWHSESYDGILAHIPGIKLAIPSTPEDAAGLFWTAIHGDDPAFILVPKHIFRKRVPWSASRAVPFGKARLLQHGDDVTVVAWGNTIEIANEAAKALSGSISVEIIDLRTLVPCDYETITQSVQKTGRLVVVHEDRKTCGFGQSIIAEMTNHPEKFGLFLASPQLVCREDVPIGYNPSIEYASLPSIERIVKAIQTTME